MDPLTIATLAQLGISLFGGGGGAPEAPDAPSGGITIGPTITSQGLQPSGDNRASKMSEAVVKADKGGKGILKDENLQMAALAAQLGSVLFGGGQAPPPPGLPRGGGIGIKPVFQNTARNLYGG